MCEQESAKATGRDLESEYTYHAPVGDQVDRYQLLRSNFRQLAVLVVELTPESREQSKALTDLKQSSMWANAAIACNE